MIPEGSLRICEAAGQLHQSVAEMLVEAARESLKKRGICILALSGGETPAPIYRMLGSPPLRERVDWRRVHLVFCDERMVPPSDTRSNFALVQRELLPGISIPPENIHRIQGEGEPAEAAREYERELKELLSRAVDRIDCVLLGLGEDGHTASLFPGSPALQEQARLTLPVFHLPSGTWRVTMTLPPINGARRVIFAVSGTRKAGILRRLCGGEPTPLLPSSLIRPVDGELVWMVDRAAAAELP